jgi:hypothetical protein
MQSCRLLPPPPGALGALSLGLELAPVVVPGVPPPDDGVAVVGGEDKGGTPVVPPDDEPLGAADCGVCVDGELGAETGGGESGAIGAT